MENLNDKLTWDLFITAFFLIIVIYSIMIGKDQTIKVILSSYIAILTSDAVGNFIAGVLKGGGASGGVIAINPNDSTIILLKIALFVFLTVALTTRGAFEVIVSDEKSPIIRMIMTTSYGILSAGLIISTIMVYVSGASLISSGAAFAQNPMLEAAEGSRLLPLMIGNYAVWFSLPAIAFVVSSLFGQDD